MAYKIYIVEDSAPLLDIMTFSIDNFAELELEGSAGSAEEALEELATLEPDVVLVDGSLPGKSGMAFVTEIKQSRPSLCCLFFSGRNETTTVRAALKAGACGYVVKGGRPKELLIAVEETMAGKCYISPSVRGWEELQRMA